MNLFIDTNIFLAFYHLSSDDLEELKKLAVLVRTRKIALYLTDQVVAEFWRNRASKIADALKRLQEQRTSFQFPQFCKDYQQYDTIRGNLTVANEALSKLIDQIESDIKQEKLKADQTIKEIFDSVKSLPMSSTILEAARTRVELGNPPGKNNSVGDAVNWEILLAAVPKKQDLVFVSDDRDYISPLDDSGFNPFLLTEWSQTRKSQIHFYRRLSALLKDKFPDIKLEAELEKERLIREFAESPNYASTHIAVSKLSKYVADFSPLQVNEIVASAVNNNQVHWIINDPDVNRFLKNVIHGREDVIDPVNYNTLCESIGFNP